MEMSFGDVATKVQKSSVIDTPSAILNVVMKRLTHNTDNFYYNSNIIRIKYLSHIRLDNIVKDKYTFGDVTDSRMLSDFKMRTEKNKRFVVYLNDVANFIVRHYCDRLKIMIMEIITLNVLRK